MVVSVEAVVEPLAKFKTWLNQAIKKLGEETAISVCLATADHDGKPSARMVLMKKFDKDGFVFFTNLNSRKAADILENPHAAMCFYWQQLGRQIRIEGEMHLVDDEEADEYFASRHPRSRLGAIVSKQSAILSDYKKFVKDVDALEKKHKGKKIQRPKNWSGFRLIPERIEFWEEGKNRLHQRFIYEKKNGKFKPPFMLYP